MKHKNKNPLSGLANFDKEGNLWLDKKIKFGSELKPKIKPREWNYLLFEACKEEGIPVGKVDNFIKSSLGCRATQWRTKKSLIKKGFL